MHRTITAFILALAISALGQVKTNTVLPAGPSFPPVTLVAPVTLPAPTLTGFTAIQPVPLGNGAWRVTARPVLSGGLSSLSTNGVTITANITVAVTLTAAEVAAVLIMPSDPAELQDSLNTAVTTAALAKLKPLLARP